MPSVVFLALAGVLVLATSAASAETAGERTGPSGLPLPRFVSLKSDRVNMRAGPGLKYPTKWVYRRAGLPVEVLREYEGWREVRDAEGVSGWVIGSLLSGRRTALIMPWERKVGRKSVQVELKSDDSANAGFVARVEAGVIANVRSCDGRWCAVSVGDVRGYLQQKALWGVYPNETVR